MQQGEPLVGGLAVTAAEHLFGGLSGGRGDDIAEQLDRGPVEWVLQGPVEDDRGAGVRHGVDQVDHGVLDTLDGGAGHHEGCPGFQCHGPFEPKCPSGHRGRKRFVGELQSLGLGVDHGGAAVEL